MCCECQIRASVNIIDSFEGCQLTWPYCWNHFLKHWFQSKRHGVTVRCAKLPGVEVKLLMSSSVASTH